jgi:GWxTD domain-containing protein
MAFFLGDRPLSRARTGAFSVAWDLRTWEMPRREMMAEARFLLGDDDFEEFQGRPIGDQERALDATWKGLDPTPETDENEAYETFLGRLAYANEHYSDDGPAIFDPRGQLYVRLGPPDELVQDVIPLNRETVSEAIQMIGDPYHTMNFSAHGAKPYNRSVSRDNVIDPRGLAGERAGDNAGYPFELWIYHTTGSPILPRDDIKEIDIGMRYLFVDRNGFGDYKLESSSSISNK